jgi:hypothetical protein
MLLNVPNFINKSTIGERGRGRIKGEDPKSKLTSYKSIVEDLEHLSIGTMHNMFWMKNITKFVGLAQ